jgi:hypothetical protein
LGLEDKVDMIEKSAEYIKKTLRNTNGISRNAAIPLKEQTYESWALKKDMRCKLKV